MIFFSNGQIEEESQSFFKLCFTDVTGLHGQTGEAESRRVLAVVTVFVSTSTMQVETRSVLPLLHADSYTSIDTDKVVQEFCTRKPRSLAFEF